MSIKNATVAGTVHNFRNGFKFFFVTPKSNSLTGGVQVFVPCVMLTPEMQQRLAAGASITVEAYKQPDGRWSAKKILKIGGTSFSSSGGAPKPKRLRQLQKNAQPKLSVGQFVIGRLARFNQEKGFGFVEVIGNNKGQPVAGCPDVFVHVSMIPANLRPVIYDGAEFVCKIDENEKGFTANVFNLLDDISAVAAE